MRLERIAAAGGRARFHRTEASSKAEPETPRRAAEKRSHRRPKDAGVNSVSRFLDSAAAEFERIVDLNLEAGLRGRQVFGTDPIERGRSESIIDLGSTSGITPCARAFTYLSDQGGSTQSSISRASGRGTGCG